MKKLLLSTIVMCIFHLALTQHKSTEYQGITDHLADGWNTWNYYSMLSYVKLPEALALNLNLRPAVQGTPYDPNYFYNNMMVDKTGIVKPKAHSLDGKFSHLQIDEWKGNVLDVKTATKEDDIYILINPIKKSATKYFVEIESGILWNYDGSLRKNGGNINADFETTNYQIKSTKKPANVARPYSSPYQSYLADTVFAIYTGDEKTLEEIKEIVDGAEKQYDLKSEVFDQLADGHQAVLSVLGWNTLYDADLDRVITPVSRGWNEAWQGFVLFEWDTYFAALLSGLDNKEMAYSNALAITKPINRFGAVAFTQQPRKQLADNSQPPVGSMVCWLLYEKYRDRWFLEEVFDELLSWNRWWINNRKNGDFLTWGASWQGAREQDARWESGLDNSPMYDDVKIEPVGQNSLLNLADVGLNSLYVADCQYLLKMAEALGRKQEAKELKSREKEFSQLIKALWSEEHGIFLNKYLDSGQFSEQLTPTLFYPMIAGIPTRAQARRMLDEHFYNKDEFYGNYMMPSCARNDPEYDNLYWRGAIWGPMNFLTYIGVKNYSHEAARELSDKSYDMFINAWRKHGMVLENIHAEKGTDHLEEQVNADMFYHWGALMGLMKFMEEGYYLSR